MIKYSIEMKEPAQSKSIQTFSFIRLKNTCLFAPTVVDFTPIQIGQSFQSSITPKFNNDHNFFTPSFVIPYDQFLADSTTCPNLQKERKSFLRRVQVAEASTKQKVAHTFTQNPIFNPRHDRFCSICQNQFRNYWTHINSKKHLSKIKATLSNNYIIDICNKYSASLRNNRPDCRPNHKVAKNIMRKNYNKKQQAQSYNEQDLIIRIPKLGAEEFAPNISTNNKINISSTNKINNDLHL